MEEKIKENKINDLFIETKKSSTKIQEAEKKNNNLSEINAVLEEKTSSLEKK